MYVTHSPKSDNYYKQKDAPHTHHSPTHSASQSVTPPHHHRCVTRCDGNAFTHTALTDVQMSRRVNAILVPTPLITPLPLAIDVTTGNNGKVSGGTIPGRVCSDEIQMAWQRLKVSCFYPPHCFLFWCLASTKDKASECLASPLDTFSVIARGKLKRLVNRKWG